MAEAIETVSDEINNSKTTSLDAGLKFDGSGHFTVSARAVAISSLAIAVACLASTAVVAGIKGADSLSTVALALAVIAFVVQIVVFVAQAATAQEQRVRAEQLNADTGALLAEVSARAKDTQSLLDQQFRRVLEAFLSATAQSAAEVKLDPEGLERRVLENVRANLATDAAASASPVQPARESTAPRAPTRRSAVARASTRPSRQVESDLESWPDSEEGIASQTVLATLSRAQRRRLGALAEDEIEASKSGFYVGLEEEPAVDDDLEKLALIKRRRVRSPDGTSDVCVLTPDGRKLARFFTAVGDYPDWLNPEVLERYRAPAPADDDIPF